MSYSYFVGLIISHLPFSTFSNHKKCKSSKLIALEILTDCSVNEETRRRVLYEIYNGLGLYYGYSGNVRKEFEYFQKGLLYDEDGLGKITGNLGMEYFDRGNYSKSLEYLKKALQQHLFVPDKFGNLTEIYFYLFKLHLKLQDKNNANLYFKKVQEILEEDNSDPLIKLKIKSRYDMARVLLLIEEHSFKSIAIAQEILLEISSNKGIDAEIIIEAIFLSIDLKIQEFKHFENESSLKELQNLFKKLTEITEELDLIVYRIQTIILKAKFELILGNYEDYVNLLNKAKEISCEYGIQSFIDFINLELEKIASEMHKWQILFNGKTSVKQKLELINLERYISDVKGILTTDERV